MPKTEEEEIEQLTKHLKKKIKASVGWELGEHLGKGANGFVLKCSHPKHKGLEAVCKIALRPDATGSLHYEVNVMKRIVENNHKEDRSQNLVRIYSAGTVNDREGNPVGYVIMELLPLSPYTAIIKTTDADTLSRVVSDFAMHTLRAMYDLHCLGFIHRDIKPENIGATKNASAAVMYDMGMSRVVTDEKGHFREPRSWVGVRGTEEWASLNSEMGREQYFIDDLWGWLYTIVEWRCCKTNVPQAWAAIERTHFAEVKAICEEIAPDVRRLMKSDIFSAQHVLENCPSQFFKISIYLRSLGSRDAINYLYIASLLQEARRCAKRKRAANVKEDTFKSDQNFLEKQFF